MAIINLRDYYPFYTSDCFMKVSEEVAEIFKEFDLKVADYRLRKYRHKAYYSLDRDDGLEYEAVFAALFPMNCVSGKRPCRSFTQRFPVCWTNSQNGFMLISFSA